MSVPSGKSHIRSAETMRMIMMMPLMVAIKMYDMTSCFLSCPTFFSPPSSQLFSSFSIINNSLSLSPLFISLSSDAPFLLLCHSMSASHIFLAAVFNFQNLVSNHPSLPIDSSISDNQINDQFMSHKSLKEGFQKREKKT